MKISKDMCKFIPNRSVAWESVGDFQISKELSEKGYLASGPWKIFTKNPSSKNVFEAFVGWHNCGVQLAFFEIPLHELHALFEVEAF
jgi:hypothetical protein